MDKQLDPAIQELKTIVETKLGMKVKFVFANIFEFNDDADLMKDAEFPCFLYFAQDKSKNKIGQAGAIVRTIPIAGMMLDQYESPTPDYKSEVVQPIINRCRQLTENLVFFINKSQYSRIQDEKIQGGVNNFNADAVYGKSDKHLFGVAVTMDWTMSEQTAGYHNLI
jgi:hypothetical protein